MASVDFVGQPLGAAHPSLTGRTAPAFRERIAGRRRGGLRRGAAGPAPQGERTSCARASSHRRQDRRHVGRFSAARRGRLQTLLRRRAPAPRAARPLRLRPARAEPRGDPRRGRGGLARLLRHHHRAGAAAAGAHGPAARPDPRAGHHRLLGQRRRPQRRHAPPGARGEPQELQAARAPAHARRSCRRCSTPPAAAACGPPFQLQFVPVSAPLSRGILATCFVELPASCAAGRARGAVPRDLRRRAVRPLPRGPAGRGGRGLRLELRRGQLRAGRARRRDAARWRCRRPPTT